MLTAASALVTGALAGCAGGPHASAPTSTAPTVPEPTTQATPKASSEPYSWQRDEGLAVELGGGPTTTLSDAVAPGATGAWLITGTQFTSSGRSVATVWTSPNATTWSKTALPAPAGPAPAGPAPAGTESAAADAATTWGNRRVVVGCVGTGQDMRAAVWVSQRAGQPFLPVADNAAFDPPSRGASSGPGGAVMDRVTAGALGLFAAGTADGQAAMWYSTDSQHWEQLGGADSVINGDAGAVLNDVLSTPDGVFAGGSYSSPVGLSAALWYSSDGIHWATVRDSVTSPSGLGDQVITALVGMGETAASTPGAPSQGGLLAVGGVRTGPAWQPASWISPNGSSWSQTSESFPLDAEPPDSPGALAYAAAGTGGHVFAVGGSPGRQRLWQSSGGLAWSEIPLPPGAAGDAGWHLGLVAADQSATVLADNLPGQPYVLVHRAKAWYQPSSTGVFGRPLPTAVPTSLVDDNGTLVLSVDLSKPGQVLGVPTSSVVVLTSSDGTSWRTASNGAFGDAAINQLLAVPGGLLAVGAAQLPGSEGSEVSGWTGAFARLSSNEGTTWPREPISPATLGGPGGPGVPGVPGGGPETRPGTSAAVLGGSAAKQSVGTAGAGGSAVAGGAGATGASVRAAGSNGTGDLSTATALTGPFAATAAGRLGNSEYVVGHAGPQAVGWYSPDGNTWGAPQPLDTSPQLGTELPVATCSAGASAVVVGSATSTEPGSMPAAWVSTDGSSWTSATFATSPPPGSSTAVDGCLSTGNGFIAFGGSTGDGAALQPALWSSGDGTSWQQLSATFTGLAGGPPVGPETAPFDGIAVGTTTWLGLSGDNDLPSQQWPAPVGGSAGAQVTPAGLWASGNAGGTWQQLATAAAPFKATVYAQADAASYVGQDPVVAGTVDGRLAIWVGTPTVAGAPS